MKDAREVEARKRLHRLAKADRLRPLREELGMYQVDVAHCLGVAPSTVSRWEAGTTRPRAAHAVQLLALLEVEE